MSWVENTVNLIREIASVLANDRVVLGFILVVGIIIWVVMLIRASAKEGNQFDLLDALRGPDRRVSKAALVQIMCLIAGLWAFLLYAIQGKMTDWMFGIVILTGVGVPIAHKLADAWAAKLTAAVPTPPQPSVTATVEVKS